MQQKDNYHFKDLQAELLHVGELKELHPNHWEVTGVIKVHDQRDSSCVLPIVAYNSMAQAMATKMKVGTTYGFNGYFLGVRSTHSPQMRLQVCWTDRKDSSKQEEDEE